MYSIFTNQGWYYTIGNLGRYGRITGSWDQAEMMCQEHADGVYKQLESLNFDLSLSVVEIPDAVLGEQVACVFCERKSDKLSHLGGEPCLTE